MKKKPSETPCLSVMEGCPLSYRSQEALSSADPRISDGRMALLMLSLSPYPSLCLSLPICEMEMIATSHVIKRMQQGTGVSHL
jgi:hypothetical protein